MCSRLGMLCRFVVLDARLVQSCGWDFTCCEFNVLCFNGILYKVFKHDLRALALFTKGKVSWQDALTSSLNAEIFRRGFARLSAKDIMRQEAHTIVSTWLMLSMNDDCSFIWKLRFSILARNWLQNYVAFRNLYCELRVFGAQILH